MRERKVGIRHILNQTKIDSFTYWASKFVLDFTVYSIGTVIGYIIFISITSDGDIIHGIMLFANIILFGISNILLVYNMSFLNALHLDVYWATIFGSVVCEYQFANHIKWIINLKYIAGYGFNLVHYFYHKYFPLLSIFESILMLIPIYALSKGFLVYETIDYQKKVCNSIKSFLDCSVIKYQDQVICCSKFKGKTLF